MTSVDFNYCGHLFTGIWADCTFHLMYTVGQMSDNNGHLQTWGQCQRRNISGTSHFGVYYTLSTGSSNKYPQLKWHNYILPCVIILAGGLLVPS